MILSKDHINFRESVREFAKSQIAPYILKWDEAGEFPFECIKKMRELKLMGLVLPEEYGGAARDTVSYSIAVEEISRVSGSVGITVAAHNSLGVYPIYLFGTDAQKNKYLPSLASGDKICAFALTEPEAGSDAANTKTTAVLEDNHYIINGNKIFITSGSVCGLVVFTACTDKGSGVKGISSFIMEKDTPGFTAAQPWKKMGLEASDTSELTFNNCYLPKDNLLGSHGDGFKQFMIILDGGRISIGAMAVGIAQGALDAVIAYLREFPASKELLQEKIADMATQIEAARRMLYYVSSLKDAGIKFTKESAMCKLFASEVCTNVTGQAVQIYGKLGCLKEHCVEKFYRQAKLTEIGEGTSEIQRIVIAREIFKGI